MLSSIKEEVGSSISQKSLNKFFKKLFSIGDSSSIIELFVSSLSDDSPEGLYELIVSCRNSQKDFAKWIYKCMQIISAQKPKASSLELEPKTKDTALPNQILSESLHSMTGISSVSPISTEAANEDEFVQLCLSSKLFLKSWSVLRLCSF